MTREEVCNLQEKQQEPEEIQLEILGRQKNPETREQKDSVQIQLSPGGSRLLFMASKTCHQDLSGIEDISKEIYKPLLEIPSKAIPEHWYLTHQ